MKKSNATTTFNYQPFFKKYLTFLETSSFLKTIGPIVKGGFAVAYYLPNRLCSDDLDLVCAKTPFFNNPWNISAPSKPIIKNTIENNYTLSFNFQDYHFYQNSSLITSQPFFKIFAPEAIIGEKFFHLIHQPINSTRVQDLADIHFLFKKFDHQLDFKKIIKVIEYKKTLKEQKLQQLIDLKTQFSLIQFSGFPKIQQLWETKIQNIYHIFISYEECLTSFIQIFEQVQKNLNNNQPKTFDTKNN